MVSINCDVAEYTGSTPVLAKEYVYGAAGLLATVEGTTVNYATPDHLGTPRVVTDGAPGGAVVSRHDYMPFGEELAPGESGRGTGYPGLDTLRQKFTGYERDTETGLDYAKARHFASTLGRFNSVDPLAASGSVGNPQTWNRYAYVLNNPLRFSDPTGMLPVGAGGGMDHEALVSMAGWTSSRAEQKAEQRKKEDARRVILLVSMPQSQQGTMTTFADKSGPAPNIPPPDWGDLPGNVEQVAATPENFKNALQTPGAAVVFLGHTTNHPVTGATQGLSLGHEYFPQGGEIKASSVFLLGCNSEAVAPLFKLGTSQAIYGVSGASSTHGLSRAAFAIAGSLGKGHSADAAARAGTAAFQPAPQLNRKTGRMVKMAMDELDVGDSVKRLR